MDDVAQEFRKSRLDLLGFFASPHEQRAFASRVPYGDYATEFHAWWFDDFHPESELFRGSFNDAEIELLQTFSHSWSGTLDAVEQSQGSIERLLGSSGWRLVVAAAQQAKASIPAAAA